jgi:ADP-ribosylglycohydrolase
MLGAIAGDIIGSVYERANVRTPDFHPLFDDHARPTDDTVLTVAVAEWLLRRSDLIDTLKKWFHLYPRAGYGGTFVRWARSLSRSPYNSWGNGSAMRVSPVGWAFETIEETLLWAKRSAEVTHNHPEGIKGAQAVAAAVFLARTGSTKEAILDALQSRFGYDLMRNLVRIRPDYRFDVSCQGSVPEAIIAWLESQGFEDAVRKAVSLGGDSDTIACIAGAVAEAEYGVPAEIERQVIDRLDARLWEVTEEFIDRFIPPR